MLKTGADLPFAYTDWSAMLLHKGSCDAAITNLRQAKDPHFALG
jgi:hypothetical protein